jgi:peptidyl-prolyl cis-trans isomerase B (cyclophilin B)
VNPHRLLAVAVATVLLAGCGSANHHGGRTARASASPAAAAGCQELPAPAARAPGHLRPPSGLLDASKQWTLVIDTNCGAFTIKLNVRTAPHAAASMVSLARAGYFNDTIFHRIVPGFVIQAGDPTQSGAGGPGYTTVDPPPSSTRYTRGVVAMAKTQDEPRGTAGSQFYVVTASDADLPADYALLGDVSSGLGTVLRIGRLGDVRSGGTGTPTAVVEIHQVVVRSS